MNNTVDNKGMRQVTISATTGIPKGVNQLETLHCGLNTSSDKLE